MTPEIEICIEKLGSSKRVWEFKRQLIDEAEDAGKKPDPNGDATMHAETQIRILEALTLLLKLAANKTA